MTWEKLREANNIDKKLDKFIDLRQVLAGTNYQRATLTLSNGTGGVPKEVELNNEDIKKLSEFLEERIQVLRQEFEEL